MGKGWFFTMSDNTGDCKCLGGWYLLVSPNIEQCNCLRLTMATLCCIITDNRKQKVEQNFILGLGGGGGEIEFAVIQQQY